MTRPLNATDAHHIWAEVLSASPATRTGGRRQAADFPEGRHLPPSSGSSSCPACGCQAPLVFRQPILSQETAKKVSKRLSAEACFMALKRLNDRRLLADPHVEVGLLSMRSCNSGLPANARFQGRPLARYPEGPVAPPGRRHTHDAPLKGRFILSLSPHTHP